MNKCHVIMIGPNYFIPRHKEKKSFAKKKNNSQILKHSISVAMRAFSRKETKKTTPLQRCTINVLVSIWERVFH